MSKALKALAVILTGVIFITLMGCSQETQFDRNEAQVSINDLVNKDVDKAWNFKDADAVLQRLSDQHKELSIGVSIHDRTNKVAVISIFVTANDLPGQTEEEKIKYLQTIIDPQKEVKKTPYDIYYTEDGMYQSFSAKKFGEVILYGTHDYNWVLRNWEAGDTYHSARYNWRDGINGGE